MRLFDAVHLTFAPNVVLKLNDQRDQTMRQTGIGTRETKTDFQATENKSEFGYKSGISGKLEWERDCSTESASAAEEALQHPDPSAP
jgi:hypothetical protein